MKDMNWQDPFYKEPLKKSDFQRKRSRKPSSSNSFANQFMGSKREEETFNEQNLQATYSDRFTQPNQNMRSTSGTPDVDDRIPGDTYLPRDDTRIETEPIFEYHQMQTDDRKSSANWRFLNLKNKKQTGDLYKKILYHNKKHRSKVFSFVSSRSGEGVSTVVANLVDYVNSHTTDKKILVIDTNLQSPNLQKIFNIPNDAYGLIDIFYDQIGVNDAVIPISSNVYVLCSGRKNRKLGGGFEQDNFIKLLSYYRQLFDYIIIDCPPVLSSPDSLSVAPASDLTFLVVQSAKVQRPVLEKAKLLLQNEECKIGGVILNRVQQVIPGWVYKFI